MYPFGYTLPMYKLEAMDGFWKWLSRLRDRKAKGRILLRIRSARMGYPGDVKNLGQGLREMRIHYGKGYRLYYMVKEHAILILLCGGNKSTQSRDIRKARQLMANSGTRE